MTKSRLWGCLALAAIVGWSAIAEGQTSPEAQQAQGIQRLEAVLSQVRSGGIPPSILNDLAAAANDLSLSAQGFAAQSNGPQTAWSLVRLADCERMGSLALTLSSTASAPTVSQNAERLLSSAQTHYAQAATLAEKSGSCVYLVKAFVGLAIIGSTRHDFGSADAAATQALRAALPCSGRQECYLDALQTKVDIETSRGELFAAASHVNGLLSLLKDSSDAHLKYQAYSDRAGIYYSFADGCSDTFEKSPEECYRLFDLSRADYVTAQQIADQAGYSYLARTAQQMTQQVDVLRNLTQQYNSHQGIPKDAFDPKTPKDVLATEIPPLGQPSPHQTTQIETLYKAAGPSIPGALTTYVQASMADIQGRPDEALQGYLRAIQMVEADRQKLSDDSARASFLDDKAGLYDRPIMMLLREKRYPEAFSLIEGSRARVTLDLLSTGSVRLVRPLDRQQFAALAQQRAQITLRQTQFVNDILYPQLSDKNADTVAKAQTDLSDMEADYEQKLLRVAHQAPSEQNIETSQPASLGALQNALRSDPADVLYYYVRDTAVVLIHIGPDSFDVRNVFLPRFELTAKVKSLLDSMRKQGTAFREDLSRELFLYLLQPALQWLHTDRIIVIPQADLVNLPFQALEDPSDGAFAGERFKITYAPSASILLKLTKQNDMAGESLLAAADPSLPGAPKEVNTLARFYPGGRVLADSLIQKAAFEHWAGSYQIIHLAVHGEFNSQEPLLSYVRLAGPDQSGELVAAEMFGLPLQKARLVTLSACETGRVRVTRANEIQGIQQALLFAGAQALLVSAWKVESEPTSQWMQFFYSEAQTKPVPEAAREAIRKMRGNPDFRSPHYWAPFLLIAR